MRTSDTPTTPAASSTTTPVAPDTTARTPIEINSKHIAEYQKNLSEQRKAKINPLTTQQLYAERLLACRDEDKEYLKVIDREAVEGEDNEGRFLLIDEQKILDLITPLMEECFVDGKALTKKLDKQHKAMVKLEDYHDEDVDLNKKRELVLNRGAFIYGQLDFLRKLADEKKLLKDAKARLDAVNKAENIDTAYSLDIGKLVEEGRDLRSGSATKKDTKPTIPNSSQEPMFKRVGDALRVAAKHTSSALARVGVGVGEAASAAKSSAAVNLYGGSQERQLEIAKEVGQVYLPVDFNTKLLLEEFIAGCEHNINELEEAIKASLETGELPKEIDIDKRGQRPLGYRLFSNTGKSLVASGQSVLHHTGLWRNSARTQDPRWKEFVQRRNEILDNIRNHPDLASSIEFRKEFLRQDLNSGLITPAEFASLSNAIDEQTKNADKQHQEYLAKLQEIVESANKDLLKKIDDGLATSDDLYKYKILHFLIISSVVFPVPLFGFLFDALEPFLGGSLDLSEFLSSFFSTNGPFGDLAWLTDKMEFDKATQWFTGDLLGGPFDLVDSVLDLGKDFAGPTAEGASGSPLSPLILSVGLEVFSGSIKKSVEHSMKQAKILPDANKALQEKIYQKYKERSEAIAGENKEYLKGEFKLREEVSKVSKIGDWLQEKYNQSPKSFKVFLENILKDKKKSEAILKILEEGKISGSNEALILDLLANKNEDLFKRVLMLRSSEETPDGAFKVGKIFSYDFHLQNFEKVKNKYLPKLLGKDKVDVAVSSVAGLTDFLGENGKFKAEYIGENGKLKPDLIGEDGNLRIEFIPDFIGIKVDGQDVVYKIENREAITEEAFGKILHDLKLMEVYEKGVAKKQRENTVSALEGIKYDAVKEELKIDFGLELKEKSGVKHGYLPARVSQLTQNSLVGELVDTLRDELSYNPSTIFNAEIIDVIKSFDAENDENCSKLKTLLKVGDFPNRITDEKLLIGAIKKVDGKLFEEFSAESQKDEFDFDKFWEMNCAQNPNLGSISAVLEVEKSAIKSQNNNLVAKAIDRMLLIDAIKKANEELFVTFSSESKEEGFDFDKFWQKNCAKNPALGNVDSLLKSVKSLRKLQSLVIEDYLLKDENKGKTREEAEHYLVNLIFGKEEALALKDLVFSPDHIKKLQAEVIKVSKNYDKKEVISDLDKYVRQGLSQMGAEEGRHIKPGPSPSSASATPAQTPGGLERK